MIANGDIEYTNKSNEFVQQNKIYNNSHLQNKYNNHNKRPSNMMSPSIYTYTFTNGGVPGGIEYRKKQKKYM